MQRQKHKGFQPVHLLIVAILAAVFFPASMAMALTPQGTEITNEASAVWQDANANNYSAISNTTTVTVTSVYTVSVTAPADQSAPSNTTAYYPYTVTNTGNDNNTFTLTAATGGGFPGSWSITLYQDDNNDGVHQAGETTVTGSTGLLTSGSTYRFFMGVAVPVNTVNGVQDDSVLSVAGTGAGSSATATDNVVTTAQAPNLSIVKAVRNTAGGGFAATANAKPGETLEYRLTVTNNGPIQATQVELTDNDGTYTTYVPGSIYVGSNGTTATGAPNQNRDDNATMDGGEVACAIDACGHANASAGGNITAYLGNTANETTGGSLANGSTVYVYFQVTVD